MRSRLRTTLTALAAIGLLAVAMIGCQPAASPTDSMSTETLPGSVPMEPSMEPSASPS